MLFIYEWGLMTFIMNQLLLKLLILTLVII
ncbi:Uncharacterised protein [Chlamydia trachomatis]|nr:Uncharacterised protein [Chlamydia trachomatis]